MEKQGKLLLPPPEIWKRSRHVHRIGHVASELVFLDKERAIRKRDELKEMLVDIRNKIEQNGGDSYHLGVIDQAITDIMKDPSNYSMAREGTLSYLYQNGLARFVPRSLSHSAQELNF